MSPIRRISRALALITIGFTAFGAASAPVSAADEAGQVEASQTGGAVSTVVASDLSQLLAPLMEAVRNDRVARVAELAERLRRAGIAEECIRAAQTPGVADGSIPLSETACPAAGATTTAPGLGDAPSTKFGDVFGTCDGYTTAGSGDALGAVTDKPMAPGTTTERTESTDDRGRRVARQEWTSPDGSTTWESRTYDEQGGLAVYEVGTSRPDGSYDVQTTQYLPGDADDPWDNDNGTIVISEGPDGEIGTHTETTIRHRDADGSETVWTIDSRSPAGKGTEPRTWYLPRQREFEMTIGEAEVQRYRPGGTQQPPVDGDPDPNALFAERCRQLAEIRQSWGDPRDGKTVEAIDDYCTDPAEQSEDASVKATAVARLLLEAANICGDGSARDPMTGRITPGLESGPVACPAGDERCVDDGIDATPGAPGVLGPYADVLVDLVCDPSVCNPGG